MATYNQLIYYKAQPILYFQIASIV